MQATAIHAPTKPRRSVSFCCVRRPFGSAAISPIATNRPLQNRTDYQRGFKYVVFPAGTGRQSAQPNSEFTDIKVTREASNCMFIKFNSATPTVLSRIRCVFVMKLPCPFIMHHSENHYLICFDRGRGPQRLCNPCAWEGNAPRFF